MGEALLKAMLSAGVGDVVVDKPHDSHLSFALALSSPSHLHPSHVPRLSHWFGRMGLCSITTVHKLPLGRNEHLHWLCHGFCSHPSSCLGSRLCFWSQLFIVDWEAELENV